MKGMIQFWRLMTIQYILVKHGIDRVVLTVPGLEHLQFLSYLNPWNWFRNRARSDAESIRLALEALGPIFVKFGQLLSTRPDIIPDDIIAELSKLQDQVPPFPGEIAQKIVEKSFGMSVAEIFSEFELTPLASASISQVHAAKLKTGESVVVKILRPDILKLINHDVALMYFVARMTMRFWSQGYRLRPVEVVAEFEQTIMDELDLMREASNASQLRRNFTGSSLLVVPKVYWDYCRGDILVLERVDGIPVSDIKQLKKKKYDLKKLAETGVEIFFTQVFRDSFFHADMHPGNIFISRHNPESPHYIAVDFGIMGTLGPMDQRYIAENLLAFFRRDYRQVAILHVESGWAPAETRIDAFESAIRCVCEPIFERPLKEISFGKLLLRLFQTAGRFNMTVQPQLLLLQKTLLNIEGLGRQLYPDLDLWSTALPFLERWMQQRIGVKALARNVVDRAPGWAEKLTDMPDLVYRAIQEHLQILRMSPKSYTPKEVVQKSPLRRLFFGSGVAFIAASAISLWFVDSQLELRTAASWFISGFGILLIFFSAMMGRKSI